MSFTTYLFKLNENYEVDQKILIILDIQPQRRLQKMFQIVKILSTYLKRIVLLVC